MRFLALFAVLATLGLAQPMRPTPRTTGEDARPTCVVEYANGGDDTPNVHKAVEQCKSNAVIHFAPGVD
jgi:hypothetical protein